MSLTQLSLFSPNCESLEELFSKAESYAKSFDFFPSFGGYKPPYGSIGVKSWDAHFYLIDVIEGSVLLKNYTGTVITSSDSPRKWALVIREEWDSALANQGDQ